jgi:hypothetical protein
LVHRDKKNEEAVSFKEDYNLRSFVTLNLIRALVLLSRNILPASLRGAIK